MRKLLIFSFVFVFLASCSRADANDTPVYEPEANNVNEPAGQAPETMENTPTSGPDCYGSEIHPVGQSIADQFEDETSYEQVMVWFCNGALFDDILTALQTEKISSLSAADLLLMQASGLTWEQIWIEIGLTEE